MGTGVTAEVPGSTAGNIAVGLDAMAEVSPLVVGTSTFGTPEVARERNNWLFSILRILGCFGRVWNSHTQFL